MINDKPVAIVLGGTVPHKELISQLKNRGYYTILVDYLADSPARLTADLHLQESTLDKETVLKIAQQHSAKLIICGCVDQANITACYVSEQMGMQAPYSYEMALKITNKGHMKQLMLDNNIPTSRYIYLDKDQSVDFEALKLRYPLIVKPADSNSANGVKKAVDKEELLKNLPVAISFSRNKRAIIEEYLTGQEISAYGFIDKEGKAKLLMTAERISAFDGEDKVIKCYASIAPARISEAAKAEAENVLTQIAKACGFKNTALFFQGIVSGDRIDVIEFAPRIGGGVCFKTIKENTGFDVISAIIDSWEGKEVVFATYHEPDRLLVVNTIYGKDGIFKQVNGLETVIAADNAIAAYQVRSTGDKVDNSRASSSRIAFFIVNAADKRELYDKVNRAYEQIEVIDSNENNIIRKDLNLVALWDIVYGNN